MQPYLHTVFRWAVPLQKAVVGWSESRGEKTGMISALDNMLIKEKNVIMVSGVLLECFFS